MRLSLPANYDSAILTKLKACDVYEIYGKLPRDSVGGGRPTYMSAPLGKRKLERYVADVIWAGMKSNYLLNASCLGNRKGIGRSEWRINIARRSGVCSSLKDEGIWMGEGGIKAWKKGEQSK